MTSVNEYRSIAAYCLRQAEEDEQDRPLWAIMARSWLQLADDAASRISEPEQPAERNKSRGRLRLVTN
jgi:hypothetical protein